MEGAICSVISQDNAVTQMLRSTTHALYFHNYKDSALFKHSRPGALLCSHSMIPISRLHRASIPYLKPMS